MTDKIGSGLIGKYVIVRSHLSGAWGGTLVAQHMGQVELNNANRLWRWWSKDGVSLAGVAANGLDLSKINDCRIEPKVVSVLIIQSVEIIQASNACEESITLVEANSKLNPSVIPDLRSVANRLGLYAGVSGAGSAAGAGVGNGSGEGTGVGYAHGSGDGSGYGSGS